MKVRVLTLSVLAMISIIGVTLLLLRCSNPPTSRLLSACIQGDVLRFEFYGYDEPGAVIVAAGNYPGNLGTFRQDKYSSRLVSYNGVEYDVLLAIVNRERFPTASADYDLNTKQGLLINRRKFTVELESEILRQIKLGSFVLFFETDRAPRAIPIDLD